MAGKPRPPISRRAASRSPFGVPHPGLDAEDAIDEATFAGDVESGRALGHEPQRAGASVRGRAGDLGEHGSRQAQGMHAYPTAFVGSGRALGAALPGLEVAPSPPGRQARWQALMVSTLAVP